MTLGFHCNCCRLQWKYGGKSIKTLSWQRKKLFYSHCSTSEKRLENFSFTWRLLVKLSLSPPPIFLYTDKAHNFEKQFMQSYYLGKSVARSELSIYNNTCYPIQLYSNQAKMGIHSAIHYVTGFSPLVNEGLRKEIKTKTDLSVQNYLTSGSNSKW